MEGEGRVEDAEQVVAASFPAYCREMLEKMDELSMTQKQLANMMGGSQQYVSKVLKGQENLSLETMSKIASCLKLSIL